MTNNNVSQLSTLLKRTEQSVKSTTGSATEDVFGSYLSQTTKKHTPVENYVPATSSPKNEIPVNEKQTAYEKEAVKTEYKENNIPRKDLVGSKSDITEETAKKLNEISDKIKETLEKKLGITEEELTQAMEKLGLQTLELMNPSQLASLLMELTGAEEAGSLLMNPDVQSLLSQMETCAQDLMTELALTPEEMQQLLQNAVNALKEAEKLETMKPSELLQAEDAKELETTNGMDHEKVQSDVSKQMQNGVKTQENDMKDGITDSDTAKITVEQKTGNQQQDATSEEGKKKGFLQDTLSQGNGEKSQVNANSQIMYQTTTQTIGNGAVVEVTQTVTQPPIDMQDIFRQVNQMTRVLITQTESSIEMQLNPENLGKIYLQVASKDGIITAHLAAQNEIVKEALESQLVTLRENMNQQGIKVEAIEVTIGTHEFEQNLEGNQQNSSEEQKEEAGKNPRRSINLNNLDELSGVMSEEESLAAKIMSQHGNRVDLTA
ncbi:MAG: flagellar hook-length control protein FliK [Lachnospiraceae bacterium]